MNTRWTLGNYTFRINPSAQSTQYEVIGDDARTLAGTLISQPTGYTETQSITATLYQPRTRVLSSKAMPNTSFMDFYSGNLYTLNANTKMITVYAPNFSTVVRNIGIAGAVSGSVNAFDVDSSGNFWVSVTPSGSSNGTETVFFVDNGGVKRGTYSYQKPSTGVNVKGIMYNSGNINILRDDAVIDITQVSGSTLVSSKTLNLPAGSYIPTGLRLDGNYFAYGANDVINGNAIMHVDMNTGAFVNWATTSSINSINDIAYDGTYFYGVNSAAGNIQTIALNKTGVDVYGIEQQILSGYLTLADDMGVQRTVAVVDYQKNRKDGYEMMFDLQLSIMTVNRGV